MTHIQGVHIKIAPVALLVPALAAADWYLSPDRGMKWAVAVGTMALIWLIVGWLQRSMAPEDARKSFLPFFAVLAGLMLSSALGMALLRLLDVGGLPSPERVSGIIAGLMLVVMGNLTPKMVGPLAANRCSLRETQALQRFTGWTFFLAGLVYTSVWIIAPRSQASLVSTLVCALAVALVIARVAWTFFSTGHRSPRA